MEWDSVNTVSFITATWSSRVFGPFSNEIQNVLKVFIVIKFFVCFILKFLFTEMDLWQDFYATLTVLNVEYCQEGIFNVKRRSILLQNFNYFSNLCNLKDNLLKFIKVNQVFTLGMFMRTYCPWWSLLFTLVMRKRMH